MGFRCRAHARRTHASMNILIATGIYPPDIGGPATYTKTVAEEFTRRGHIVSVVTYVDVTAGASAFYRVRRVARTLPKGIRHVAYFFAVLKGGMQADIIYAQDTVSAGLPALFAAFLLRKRFAVRVTGDYAWEQAMQRFGVTELLDEFLERRYGFRVEAIRMCERFVARGADVIIVPSRYLKGVVEKWGAHNGRIHVVYNAVAAPPTTVTKDEARRSLGQEGTLLLSVGRLVPWKGFRMLIQLMPKLVQRIPDARLVIVGSGPDEHVLKEAGKHSGAADHIVFTGAIPRERLAAYMRAADILLFNTGYEGFSHQLLEEMSIGVPIITTCAGGNAEIVQNGVNALVARYNDSADWEEKIIQLLHDPALLARLGAPHVSAMQFTVPRMVEETVSVLSADTQP